jgi:hypothetical protein
MTHSWCRDIPRDEAVRAAEDGRPGPLPTLADVIAQPFADQAKYSPSLSESGKGQSGMRTERVALEVTHNNPWDINHWPWDYILRLGKRESVRVVEDPIPPAPVSRPAETRQTKAERIGGGWWLPKYDLPSPPPPPPPAPPRVHRGSGVFDANGDEVPWEGVVAMLTDERDAAIREREELRKECERRLTMCERMKQERDQARFHVAIAQARVAELESQLESVACRAATAETALREIFAQDYARSSVNGASWKMHDIAEKALKSAPTASGAAGTGWLTAEERRLIEGMMESASAFPPTMHWHSGCTVRDTLRILQSILARSSPPEVVLPRVYCHGGDGEPLVDLEDVRAALAAAGVTVKEVG